MQQDGSKKLPGIGGVFNAVNMDVYHYAGQNPVKLVDPDGNDLIIASFEVSFTGSLGFKYQNGYILEFNKGNYNLYEFNSFNITNGSAVSIGFSILYNTTDTINEYLNKKLSFEVGYGKGSVEISTDEYGNIDIGGGGLFFPSNLLNNIFKIGLSFNFLNPELSSSNIKKIGDKEKIISVLNEMKKAVKGNTDIENVIDKAIIFFKDHKK